MFLVMLACDSKPSEASKSASQELAPRSAPSAEALGPIEEPASEDDQADDDKDEHAPFDPLTVESARVRVTAVEDRRWVACGRVHEVGTIEVDVLEVGVPRPKLALRISCPADVGGALLKVGKVLRVELHPDEQSPSRARRCATCRPSGRT